VHAERVAVSAISRGFKRSSLSAQLKRIYNQRRGTDFRSDSLADTDNESIGQRFIAIDTDIDTDRRAKEERRGHART